MQIRLRSAALVAGLMLSVSGAALATPPATGLGQAWPNATDMSTNSSYHVWVFLINGIQYIQVNDVNGNVLGGVGNVGSGAYFVLPVGQFAQQVSTPQQSAPATAATPTASAAPVYNDGATSVTATPMSDGSVQLNAKALCDPIDCNTKGP